MEDDAIGVNVCIGVEGAAQAEEPDPFENLEPQIMMERVAADFDADLDYNERVPMPYSEHHVEAAFQAQQTSNRVLYAIVICVLVGSLDFWSGIVGMIYQTKSWALPPWTWLFIGTMFYVMLAGICFQRKRWAVMHKEMRVASILITLLFFLRTMVYQIILTWRLNVTSEKSFATGYAAGLILASSLLVLAHIESPLWTFVLPLAHLSVTAVSPNSDELYVPIYGCVVGIVLGCLARQILLQHRSIFSAQVRLHRMKQAEMTKHEMQMQVQMHKAETERALLKLTTLQLAKHKVDSEAFATLNHAGKRTMLNSIFWANKMQKDVVPKLEDDDRDAEAYAELKKMTGQILNDNMDGVDMCR